MRFLCFFCIFDYCSFGILLHVCTTSYLLHFHFLSESNVRPLYRQYTYIVGKYKMYYELKKLEEKLSSWISIWASSARSLFAQHKPAEYQESFVLLFV